MVKMKKASAAIVLAGMLLINRGVMVLASEEISVDEVTALILQADDSSSNLAERLVISDIDKELYGMITKLINEKGIEQISEKHTWIEVSLDDLNLEDSQLSSLAITQDQYATYLSYELNNEIYHLTYYSDGTINKKITMYYGDGEYIYNQNYNNTKLSFGDSSELDKVEEEEQEDPVIVDLKETKTQLQQRLDVLAITFATFLFGFIMFFIWGRKLLLKK